MSRKKSRKAPILYLLLILNSLLMASVLFTLSNIYSVIIEGDNMAWKPNPGPQTAALERDEFEILYGGARGGGKTEGGLAWMIEPEYISNKLYRGLVIRRNADDLSDWSARAEVFYAHTGARLTGKPPIIKFPSGAFIRTGHLKDEHAYTKYQGHEYQKILVEELTQIPREKDYEMLISSARSTVPELPAQVFNTTNPGGVGHVWVKSRFVDVARLKTYYYAGGKRSRVFIPAKVDDCPQITDNDPGYVYFLESIKDDKLRRAWRYGDWDTFSGQFFEMWSNEIHIVKPFLIPEQWNRFRGLDWGYFPGFGSVGWFAIDYEGNHYIYREFYEQQNTPTIMARKVLSMTDPKENIITTLADPSIWTRSQYVKDFKEDDTTESIADIFIREGLYCTRANNNRVSGWAKMRDMLYWDSNLKPKLFIFENCVNTIRTIPGLVHDDTRVEDVDTDGEDHLADLIRYVLMHTAETGKPEAPKTEIAKFIDSLPGSEEDMKEWTD